MDWTCKINGITVDLISPVTVQEYKESPGLYRIKVTGDITFMDNPKTGYYDYTLIKRLELTGFNDIHTIEIYKTRDNRRKYKGAFKIQDCSFSGIDKSVTIRHTLWDDWAYLKSKLDTKVNAMTALTSLSNVKTITCNVYTWFEFMELKVSDITQHPDAYYYKSAFVDVRYNGSNPYIAVYYTEKAIMERGYIMDDTWTIHADYGNSIEYIRYPPDGTFFDYIMYSLSDFYTIDYGGAYSQYVFGSTKPGAPTIEEVVQLSNYTTVYEGSVLLYNGDATPKEDGGYIGVPEDWETKEFKFILSIRNDFWVNGKVRAYEVEYRGIELKCFINNLILNAAPSFKGSLKSTFLFNDHGATGEDDKYSANKNDYVYGNIIKDKYVIVKPDFIRPSADVLSTNFKVSLNDVINNIKLMYQLVDYIDKDGNYRIEHVSYFESKIGIDIRSSQRITQYSYDSENILNKDIFDIIDSGNIDFIGQTIEYPDVLPMEDKENVNTNTISYISVDVEYMNRNLDGISQDGIVLVEVDNNSICVEEGIISGYNYQNAGLSISKLLACYYGWELNRSIYILMGEEKEANTIARIKKNEVDFIYNGYIDIRNNIITTIGSGEVEKIEYSTADDNKYKVSLLYE